MQKSVLFAFLLFALPTVAAPCLQADKAGYSRCLDQELIRVERELTAYETSYTTQLQELADKSGRNDPLRLYRESRRFHDKYVLEHCRWRYLSLIPNSQEGAILYKECLIRLKTLRIGELAEHKIPQ